MDSLPDLERRITKLENRIEWLDEHGTRQMGTLSLQIAEAIKDIGELKGSKFTNVLVYIATIIPLYALVIAVLVQHH